MFFVVSAVISVYDDGLDVCSSHMHTPVSCFLSFLKILHV